MTKTANATAFAPLTEVCLRALGETEQENREIGGPECDHYPIPAAPPPSFPGNALLDEAAAKIAVDQHPRAARSTASARLPSPMSSALAKRANDLSIYIGTCPH